MQKEKEKTSDQITKEEYKRKGKQVAADEPIQVAGLSLPPKKMLGDRMAWRLYLKLGLAACNKYFIGKLLQVIIKTTIYSGRLKCYF